MDPAEQRRLGDQASNSFKFAQSLRQILPESYFGVSRLNLSSEQVSDILQGNQINLAEAQLSHPHDRTRTTIDLISLLSSVNKRLRDTSATLDSEFLKDCMILAANLGRARELSDIPAICNIDTISYLKNSKNLRYKPGALISESIGPACAFSLNSSGIGDFVLVEQKSSAFYRLYHHNLVLSS